MVKVLYFDNCDWWLAVLVVVIAADGIIHQLVDDHRADENRRVGRAGRLGLQPVELIRAVRPAAHGHAVLLRGKLDGIQNPAVIGLDEEKIRKYVKWSQEREQQGEKIINAFQAVSCATTSGGGR